MPDGHLDDPDLNHPQTKRLAIDWAAVKLDSDADALALWARIAPTGDDAELKLDEIPGDGPISTQLAIAMLHEGNFRCAPPAATGDCAKPVLDVDPPAPAASLADPCLRRVLALWSIAQLDEADLPAVRDALKAIAALPPPESQLVASAIKAIPETDQDGRLELLAIAWGAGQRDLVNAALGGFDEAHLVAAVTRHHIEGALDVLSAEANRATYLAEVGDEQLSGAPRAQAIVELAAADAANGDKLGSDLRLALAKATKSPDCAVAAMASRVLVQHGETKFGPLRPHAHKPEPMMRAMCVLASYELLQRADEASYLLGYIPAKGLELARVVYDPYNEVDTDGDGDPHTERTIELVKRDEVVMPELEDLVRALRHCTGTSCRSDEHEFRFTFRPGPGGELVLARLEIADRPPCPSPTIPAP